MRGSKTADVAILEFSDFECPYCSRFATDTLPAIEHAYAKTGRVLMAFRNFPLPTHSFAVKAAEAAMCADEQGKFWDLHDRMYRDQRHLGLDVLRSLAGAIGVNVKIYEDCMAGRGATRIQRDVAQAHELGVARTPAFFLGTIQPDGRLRVQTVIEGARPFKDFQVALDALLGSGSAR